VKVVRVGKGLLPYYIVGNPRMGAGSSRKSGSSNESGLAAAYSVLCVKYIPNLDGD
jgi:hypothetical protein